eukprot:2172150-Rhodomonas_salina.2
MCAREQGWMHNTGLSEHAQKTFMRIPQTCLNTSKNMRTCMHRPHTSLNTSKNMRARTRRGGHVRRRRGGTRQGRQPDSVPAPLPATPQGPVLARIAAPAPPQQPPRVTVLLTSRQRGLQDVAVDGRWNTALDRGQEGWCTCLLTPGSWPQKPKRGRVDGAPDHAPASSGFKSRPVAHLLPANRPWLGAWRRAGVSWLVVRSSQAAGIATRKGTREGCAKYCNVPTLHGDVPTRPWDVTALRCDVTSLVCTVSQGDVPGQSAGSRSIIEEVGEGAALERAKQRPLDGDQR